MAKFGTIMGFRLWAVGSFLAVAGLAVAANGTLPERKALPDDSLKAVTAGAGTALAEADAVLAETDSAFAETDSVLADDIRVIAAETAADPLAQSGGKHGADAPKRDWSTWRPNPQRALWLAMVIPGGGQIYNRKYWKLPIIYGGIMGCLYAMNWNNMMYKDYSQAYLDIMDSDPATESYNKFLHLGKKIDSSNEARYKQIFKSRKDKYRRWRDLSFFCLIGVYAISVIDAYVDAELSEFDISKDLSLRIEPAVMGGGLPGNRLEASSIGVNCSLKF